MRNWKKRFLALALSVILTLGLLPGTACAAVGQLLHNSSQQNEALLEALSELAGPEDAREFYALLQEYGLLDEDGQFVTHRTIDLDGEAYTLEEIEALLSDPEVILQSYALAQMEQRGKLIWAQAPEMGIAYGEEARTLLDAVLEDIAAGRLGVHTLGGTEDAGMPEVIFQWRVSGREDEPPYYGTDYEREIRVAVPDTASSTLAVMERLAGQNG